MCGIIAAVAQRDVAPVLLEGLRRLEYRGYDSAGLAVIDNESRLQCLRRTGKVAELSEAITATAIHGGTGIAHTRWATHGEPSERNAHPHLSGERIAVVHNGIIENHEALRATLKQAGYVFASDTDTEVIAHLVHHALKTSDTMAAAVQHAVHQLNGAYGIVVIDCNQPDQLVAARSGSPLVVGLGIDEHFIASDQLALFPVTRRFIFLEEGDVAVITRRSVRIVDGSGVTVERPVKESDVEHDTNDKGPFRHYMLKEIYEQPEAIANTLAGRLGERTVNVEALGERVEAILPHTRAVQIIACGTSYHAGLVARYWFEALAGIPCTVEIASEFRYRQCVIPNHCLLVTVSQSGETADTLAALKQAKAQGYLASLAICNVSASSMVRESDAAVMTRAGTEVGVASTKAFTTQLVALLMLVVAMGRYTDNVSAEQEADIVKALRGLPHSINDTLALGADIENLAQAFAERRHCLFLGRGMQYPIAMEGALKLKEISYIHAEAYAAGELKHGPLALIDNEMPVVVVAPNNELLEKLKANMEEVRARGGLLYVFADRQARLFACADVKVLPVEAVPDVIAPILYTIPLQLLSYYVAIIKGTDVDQPRNLAKSVTVE